ncbi:hypothetical protein BGZ82_003496, partial [Podila clonocystis]
MYVELNIELITKVIGLLCNKEIKAKYAKKICKSLAMDDDVEKYHFCGATCTKSKRICMKEVKEEGLLCHVHDPERKCQGVTLKGDRCGGVAKVSEMFCFRHREDGENAPKKSTYKSKKSKKAKEIVESSENDEESACEEDITHKRKRSKKDKKRESKKSKKSKEIVEFSENDDESAYDEEDEGGNNVWQLVKESHDDDEDEYVPTPRKEDIVWKQCSFDKGH